MRSTGSLTPMASANIASLGRVAIAMVTPFRPDGALDLDAAQRLAGHLVDHGTDMLVLSGTTGESPTTSDDEKIALLRAVLETVGDRASVVTGVGSYDTAHSIESAKAAEVAGAQGLLVVTPYYNKPPQDGIKAHFTAIADATGLGVIAYDIPSRTGTKIRTETLIQLAEHPRIVAVKDAAYDIAGTTKVLAETDLAYYSGADELNLALLSIGAVGVISVVGHVASDDYRAMIDAVDAGDLAKAREIDRRLVPAVEAMMTRTQGVITAKAALKLAGVLEHATTRPPLPEATPEQYDWLATDLKAAGVL